MHPPRIWVRRRASWLRTVLSREQQGLYHRLHLKRYFKGNLFANTPPHTHTFVVPVPGKRLDMVCHERGHTQMLSRVCLSRPHSLCISFKINFFAVKDTLSILIWGHLLSNWPEWGKRRKYHEGTFSNVKLGIFKLPWNMCVCICLAHRKKYESKVSFFEGRRKRPIYYKLRA